MSLGTRLNKKIDADRIGIILIAAIPLLAIVLTFIPMSSNANIELPFLEQSEANKVLVFGGFPSCSSACPISLSKLQKAYEDYIRISGKNDLQVIFVNIQLDTPKEVSEAYAKSFHQDFSSYSVPSSQAAYFYKSISMQTFSDENVRPDHKGFIYLFSSASQQWKLKRIFNSEVTQENLLKQLLKQPA